MKELEIHLKNTINNNKLIQINKNIFLSNYEINILKVNNIQYEQASTYQEILYFIEDILEIESDNPELEQIILSISERHYYQNTHK